MLLWQIVKANVELIGGVKRMEGQELGSSCPERSFTYCPSPSQMQKYRSWKEQKERSTLVSHRVISPAYHLTPQDLGKLSRCTKNS